MSVSDQKNKEAKELHELLLLNSGANYSSPKSPFYVDPYNKNMEWICRDKIGKLADLHNNDNLFPQNSKTTNTKGTLPSIIDDDENLNRPILMAALLSNWIYNPDPITLPFKHLFKKPYVAKQNTKYSDIKNIDLPVSLCQWSIIEEAHNNSKRIYLVFRGTKPEDLVDIIINMNSSPQYYSFRHINNCNNRCNDIKYEKYNQINVHGGMYRALYECLEAIINKIHEAVKNNKELKYIDICGHSLGGGLATLFTLDFINRNLHKEFGLSPRLFTFGYPNIIGLNPDVPFNKLSTRAQEVLNKLKNISYHYINRFDPVPRLLINKMYRNEFLLYMGKFLLKNYVGWKSVFIDSKITSGINIMSKFINQYDLFCKYQLWGKYIINYDFNIQNKKFVSCDAKILEQILSYYPPFSLTMENKTRNFKHDWVQKEENKVLMWLKFDLNSCEKLLKDHSMTSYINICVIKYYISQMKCYDKNKVPENEFFSYTHERFTQDLMKYVTDEEIKKYLTEEMKLNAFKMDPELSFSSISRRISNNEESKQNEELNYTPLISNMNLNNQMSLLTPTGEYQQQNYDIENLYPTQLNISNFSQRSMEEIMNDQIKEMLKD